MAFDVITKDLAGHAADKVSEALKSVQQLEDDPTARFQIALMAAVTCIGNAAGNLIAGAGEEPTESAMTSTIVKVLDLLRLNTEQGPDAVAARFGNT